MRAHNLLRPLYMKILDPPLVAHCHTQAALRFDVKEILTFWRPRLLVTRRTPTLDQICTYTARASASETYFQDSKIHLHIYIQSMQFPLITYGMAL